MKSCKTCCYRWTRNTLWYCRKTTIAEAKLIGNEEEMKKAKGCKSWQP